MAKRVNRSLAPAMVLLGLLSLPYFQLVALPVLRGASDVVGAVAGDSFNYHALAESSDFPYEYFLGALLNADLSAGYFSLFGVSGFGYMLAKLFGENYTYAVFVANFILLYVSLRNFRAIYLACLPNGRHFYWFVLMVLANPGIYVNLFSLNKEIWGVFFVSAFLKYALVSQAIPYLFFAFIALFFRDAYFVVAVVFWLIIRLPFRPLIYLIVTALVVAPFVVANVPDISNTGESLDARSGWLFSLLLSIENFPLGYLLTYPVKVALQFFSATLPHRYAEMRIDQPYSAAITLSSTLFLIVCTLIAFRVIERRGALNKTMLRLVFSYTLVFCLVPYSVHRLFVPLYPVIVALLFLPPETSTMGMFSSVRTGTNARLLRRLAQA